VTESEGIEMSDDQPASLRENVAPVLRREALLPNERSRGLGTVAVVCTMAGVASGLALATTLMAMQVADTMSARTCAYRATPVEIQSDHGFLGIRYVFRDGVAEVQKVLPGTPAESIGLMVGDHVIAVDNNHIDSNPELQELIFGARPGTRPRIEIERDGTRLMVQPTLVSWPSITY
jgi:S1-C subfamily serine protease